MARTYKDNLKTRGTGSKRNQRGDYRGRRWGNEESVQKALGRRAKFDDRRRDRNSSEDDLD